jgi:AcrR family transcriptional regulator
MKTAVAARTTPPAEDTDVSSPAGRSARDLQLARKREPRAVGRPRSGEADRAILDAAMALLSEVGLGGLTMSAVVSRSGVARATVYRRYPTREALLSATMAQVKGREPFALSGDMEADIATGAIWAAAVLGEAPFRRFLPLLVAESLRSPAAARGVIARVAPNHGGITREYRERAAAAGLRTDIEPSLAADMVQGAMLMRLLSTGIPPDTAMVRQVVDVVLRGLREPATG